MAKIVVDQRRIRQLSTFKLLYSYQSIISLIDDKPFTPVPEEALFPLKRKTTLVYIQSEFLYKTRLCFYF